MAVEAPAEAHERTQGVDKLKRAQEIQRDGKVKERAPIRRQKNGINGAKEMIGRKS